MTISEAKLIDTQLSGSFVTKQKILLVLATILILAPFITKPVHMDDPVFVWVAQNISAHPLDFFGFNVNWYGHSVSVADINKNPPLTSYFMALSASILGWSELALHIVFIIPAIFLVLGTYKLAEIFDANPVGTSFSLVCCPVVLISSTTLMVDLTMLSLWVWAVVYWVQGISNQSRKMLLISGLLIALAAFTKYIAISLIPLLMAYSLLVEKKFTKNTSILALPLLLIALFFWYMQIKYGQNFFANIFGFSIEAKSEVSRSLFDNFIVGMIFIGGCLLFPLFYLRRLFSHKQIFWLIVSLCIVFIIFLAAGKVGYTNLKNQEGFRFGLLAQWTVFFVLGAFCLYLLYLELRNNNQPLSWLLFLWIFGILFFAFFLNWSTNGRSILTIAPPVAILVWRRLDMNKHFQQLKLSHKLLPLLPTLLIAITVTWADYSLARSMQDAAVYSARNFTSANNTLWFQGSWGFQYYMQQYGAKRLVINESVLKKGDILVMPTNNSNIFSVPRNLFEVVEIKEFETTQLASVLSYKTGAGFYTSLFGSLPYVLGKGNLERYYILRAAEPWKAVITKD